MKIAKPQLGASAPGLKSVEGLPLGLPKGVKVVRQLPLSSADGRAFVTTSGSRVAMVYPAAVNFQASDGQWAAINTTADPSGNGWAQAANGWNAQLPSDLSSPVTITRRGAQMSMALVGAAGSGAAQASTVSYASALTDTSVQYTYLNEALKENLILSSADAPSSFSWDVTVPAGYSLRARSGGVQVLNSAGGVEFDLVEPSVSDASGAVGPIPTMSVTQNGTTWVVNVVVDSTWLSSSTRAWPVTVDPTVDASGSASYADCQITSAASGTACSVSPLAVGYDGTNPTRMLLSWSLNTVLPWDAQVTQASVNVEVASRSNSTSVPVSMYPTTSRWDDSATWTATGYGSNWSTAGGDYNSTTQTEANATVTGTGWYAFPDTTQIAQAMTSQYARAAFLFKETTENVSNSLSIDSWQNSSSSNWPYIQVTYSLPTGTSPDSTFVAGHQLSDNSQIAVNPVDGDVVYQVTDSNTAGSGLDQTLTRTYDSMSAGSKGDLGYGWFMNDGADTTLTQESDGMLLRMFGNHPEFFQEVPGSPVTFTSPAGFDASLVLSGGVYTLTFNDSQQVWTFGHQIGSVFVLSTEKDRNGNAITFNYTCGTTCTMGTITDTESRTTTLAHNSNGYITSITDPTFSTNSVTRSVGYAYANGSDPNELTGVTDADSHSTSYQYDSSENLTQITDGDSNVTKLNYGSTSSAHQLLSITYAYGTSVAATWSFGYNSSSSLNGGSTSVTDPNGHTTVYTYNNQGEILSVTDPLGNQRSTTWTSGAKANVLSDAIGSADNSTLSWNANGNDELDSVALASSGTGNGAATSTDTYNTSSSVSGYKYLPSSTTDAQSNCSNSLYDSSGNVTGSDAGGAMSGGTCSSTMANSTAAYQGDSGTTCTGASTGALCSQTNPNSHTISFTYDGDGNVASVTPPTPDGESTYTYDGASRVVGTEDGNGNSGAPASIVPVQSVTQNVSTSNESSQTVTLSSTVTAGDALVMAVEGEAVSGAMPVVSSITGGGVTWVRGVSGGSASIGDDEIWYGLNSTGGSGTTTITITMTAGTSGIGAWLGEFSGVATSSGLDVSGTSSGNGTTVSAPALTTTKNGDFIMAAVNSATSPGSPPPSPWADIAGPTYPGSGLNSPMAYRTLTTAGSVPTATWTQSSALWSTVAIALKPATESVAYTYDNMDRVTQILYGGDSACVPSSGDCITYGYDNNGNLTSMTDNTGTTSWTYDQMGRVIKKAMPSSADACSGQTGMTYGYDNNGNLTTFCDASGTTHYTYDAANNNTSVTEPGGTSGCTIAKNASQSPIQAVQSVTQNMSGSNESSQTVTLPSNVTAGDALVLVVEGEAGSGTMPVVSTISGGGVTWARGASGSNNTIGDDEIWYGLNSSGGSGTTTITITMTAGTSGIGAWLGEFNGVATSSGLDVSGTNSGNGTTVSAPSLTTTKNGDLIMAAVNSDDAPWSPPNTPWTDVTGPAYPPDATLYSPAAYRTLATAGSVPTATWTQSNTLWATVAIALKPAATAAVSQNLTTGCTAMAYDQDGRRTTTQLPGGATQTTSYTNAGFVSEIKGTTSTGSTITDYKYNYTTSAHNDTTLLQTRIENDPSTGNTNVTTTYGYDALNRLTSAVASTGTNYYYGYDADGNMTCTQTGGACSTSTINYNADDELTSNASGSFTYDANGNETASAYSQTFTYNPKGQTSSRISSGTTYNATYTGADSSQRTSLGSTTFVPNGNQILESTTGGTTTYYTYDGAGNLIGFRTGGTSYYYLYDNLGSVVAVINSSGTISDRYSYSPYGAQTVITSGVSNQIAFQGGYLDPDGLIKFGTRYYGPGSSHWLQPDPDNQATADPYVFDGDDPINLSDPLGLNVCKSVFSDIGLGGACKTVSNSVTGTTSYYSGVVSSDYNKLENAIDTSGGALAVGCITGGAEGVDFGDYGIAGGCALGALIAADGSDFAGSYDQTKVP